MSVKYEILKRLVKAANIKKMWTGMSTEELLENRRRQNAKNRIPDLKDDAFDISRIEIMGCLVLKLIHRKKADRANLFLIGGGMISAPRPGSIKKALRFAKETGLDVFVPYYPLCTDYPLTRAYEMIHETYRIMLQDYKAENVSVLETLRSEWFRISTTAMEIRRCPATSWQSLRAPAWIRTRNGSGCWSWTKRTWPSRRST